MRLLLVVLFCFFGIQSYSQDSAFDGHKWEAPYHLSIPKDWGIERFLIPISFAPQIPYKGVEDIRFTPGWGKVESEEYWTYSFLWWLDGKLPEVEAVTIADNLKAYYTGLIEINREGFKVPKEKITAVQTSFKETKTYQGDIKTFTGTIQMLDYMQQQPIKLNCIVHMKACIEEKKTVFFYEISPRGFDHQNWKVLDQLWIDFKCKKV